MSDEVIPVPIETELDALFGQYIAGEQARGLVYGVTSPEGLVHARGFGVAGEDEAPPDADTVFPIASMSKSFMACAALIARDRGLISLSDPITRYVPEFRVSATGVRTDDVPTIEMLLSMCGGLTEDNSWVDPFIDLPTDALLAKVSQGVRLSRLPGAAFEYSNLGYTLACLAVSRAAGRPLGDFVRDELLVPLGLSSTHFDDAVPDGVPRAVGYALDARGRWTPFAPKHSDAFAGAGGIVSTVTDLARWITWLGEAFRPDGPCDDTVLSGVSRRELQRAHVPATPAVTLDATGGLRVSIAGYGLGLAVDADVHHGTFVWHSGGLPGFLLSMRWHPNSGSGMVVLTNSHRGDPIALGKEALGRVLARDRTAATTVTLWAETAALRADAERLIRAWDDDLAARIFADNVDFDRPLTERHEELDRLVAEVGPLLEPRAHPSIVSAVTPADVTWSLPAERGELICMIHLTPVEPAQIQEFVVEAVPADRPRSAAPVDVSPRRGVMSDASISPLTNARVRLPGLVHDDRELRALAQTRLDDSFKGIPLGRSVTLDELGTQGWNVAAGDLALPIVTLDERALAHNIATMQSYCDRHGVRLAPHGKTTMAPQLFARQLRQGAWAMTAATPTQVAVMRRFGVQRIILANELADGSALTWIAEELKADPSFEFMCLVDDPGTVARMDEILQAEAGDARLAVLVEIGHPGGRGGARNVDQALAVADAVHRAPRLRLAGVEAFEGALASDVSADAFLVIDELCARVREATVAMARRELFETPDVIVTAGGSAYFDRVVASLADWSEVDASVTLVLRSGCYVSHDGGKYETQSPLAQRRAPGESLRLINALTLWGTVLSRPEPDVVLVGAGMRDAPVDLEPPRPRECLSPGGPPRDIRTAATTFRVMDQHTFVRVCAEVEIRPGDIMTFDLSHPCTAFDKYRLIPVIDAATTVVDGVLTFF